MAKKDIEELQAKEKLERVSAFLDERREIYQQEHRDTQLQLEKFVWESLIGVLDEISGIIRSE